MTAEHCNKFVDVFRYPRQLSRVSCRIRFSPVRASSSMDASRVIACASDLLPLSTTVHEARRFQPVDCQNLHRAESTHILHTEPTDMNLTEETSFQVLAGDSDEDAANASNADASLVRWHKMTYTSSHLSQASSKRLSRKSFLGRHSVLLNSDDDEEEENDENEVDVDLLWGNIKKGGSQSKDSLKLFFEDSRATSTIGLKGSRPKNVKIGLPEFKGPLVTKNVSMQCELDESERQMTLMTKSFAMQCDLDESECPKEETVKVSFCTQVSFSDESTTHSSQDGESCGRQLEKENDSEDSRPSASRVNVSIQASISQCSDMSPSMSTYSLTNEGNESPRMSSKENSSLEDVLKEPEFVLTEDDEEDEFCRDSNNGHESSKEDENKVDSSSKSSYVRNQNDSTFPRRLSSGSESNGSLESFFTKIREAQTERKLENERRQRAWDQSLDDFINDDTSEYETSVEHSANDSFQLDGAKKLHFSSESSSGSVERPKNDAKKLFPSTERSRAPLQPIENQILENPFHKELDSPLTKNVSLSPNERAIRDESPGKKTSEKRWRNQQVLAFLEPSSSESSSTEDADEEESSNSSFSNDSDSEKGKNIENIKPKLPTEGTNTATVSREPLRTKDKHFEDLFKTPGKKEPLKLHKVRSFIDSLSLESPDQSCHPDAERFLTRFSRTKTELALKLYAIFNSDIFEDRLPKDMSIQWKPRLTKTAGRCHYKIDRERMERYCIIDLSSKVIDSADRLRDTLIHEMCHAAVYLISGSRENHGRLFKSWGRLCVRRFPELPLIERCHTYEIFTKYVYKCEKCGLEYRRHSKSIKDTARCGRCRGNLHLLIRSDRNKQPEQASTPRTPNPFAMFVKENYKHCRTPGSTHKQAMESLSKMFAKSKLE